MKGLWVASAVMALIWDEMSYYKDRDNEPKILIYRFKKEVRSRVLKNLLSCSAAEEFDRDFW